MILEELMLDLMYHLPSQKKVKEFEVTQQMWRSARSRSQWWRRPPASRVFGRLGAHLGCALFYFVRPVTFVITRNFARLRPALQCSTLDLTELQRVKIRYPKVES